jgi:predicted nucleotidyltransferase
LTFSSIIFLLFFHLLYPPVTHPTRLDIQPLLDDFVQAMRRLYGRRLSRIVLFGSFARGEAHAESDVDLLVLLGEEEIDILAEQDRMRPDAMALTLEHERLVSAFPGTEAGYIKRDKLIYYHIAEDGQTLFPTS